MEEQTIYRSVSMDSLFSEDDSEIMSQFIHFYTERIASKERLKKHMIKNRSRPENIQQTSLDTAMETLCKEMAAMMDNDLELTKQLLVLQGSIEDILGGEDDSDSFHSNSSDQYSEEVQTCNSFDQYSEEERPCSRCSCTQNVSERLTKNSNENTHITYSSMDSQDCDNHTSVRSLKKKHRGGHQKQTSNDSGYCCVFQDLEVTI